MRSVRGLEIVRLAGAGLINGGPARSYRDVAVYMAMS
jgi:hypothetical protein